MADPEEKSKLSPDSPEPPLAVSDSILLRLELDEQAVVPTVMDELQEELQLEVSPRPLEEKTPGDVQSADTDADREALQASLGQRKMREIVLERYCSQGMDTVIEFQCIPCVRVFTRSPAASDDTPVAELPDKIPFFSGIPVVEVTRGVVHLFRDRYWSVM